MATPDPRDILALQSAVNDASSRTTALWVSFMTFAAYLIVAAGSVNHLSWRTARLGAVVSRGVLLYQRHPQR